MPARDALLALLLVGTSTPAFAQTYTAAADMLFYGDNTEFANPFRAVRFQSLLCWISVGDYTNS